MCYPATSSQSNPFINSHPYPSPSVSFFSHPTNADKSTELSSHLLPIYRESSRSNPLIDSYAYPSPSAISFLSHPTIPAISESSFLDLLIQPESSLRCRPRQRSARTGHEAESAGHYAVQTPRPREARQFPHLHRHLHATGEFQVYLLRLNLHSKANS